jgi:ketosteroid isomerase-like protein
MRINIVIIAFLFSITAIAQKQVSGDQQQIKQVLAVQQAAWNKGDLDGFMAGYWKSDSLMFIGKRGVTKGWLPTLDNYKKSYPDKASMGTLQFDIISIEITSKNTAYVVGKWHLKREESKGDLEGHFTLLFKKIDKHWVIVSDHSS